MIQASLHRVVHRAVSNLKGGLSQIHTQCRLSDILATQRSLLGPECTETSTLILHGKRGKWRGSWAGRWQTQKMIATGTEMRGEDEPIYSHE